MLYREILLSAACVFIAHPHAAAAPRESAAAIQVAIEAETSLETVKPQIDPLQLTVRARDAEGAALRDGTVRITLLAPESSPLSSTDFPIVEGSTLVDSEVSLDQGVYRFSFIPPIRGDYQLRAELTKGGSGQATWQGSIGENPHKVRNLVVFLSILAFLSLISGSVIGYTRSSAQALVLSLLLLSATSEPAAAHEAHRAAPQDGSVAERSEAGQVLSLNFVTAQPRVGELSELRAQLLDRAQRGVPARFRLTVTQLEHQREVLATEILAPEGSIQWKGQFYDGSAHRIDLTATPLAGGSALHVARDVDVAGVAPPPTAIAKSFGVLLLIVAFFVATGCAMGLSFRNWREAHT